MLSFCELTAQDKPCIQKYLSAQQAPCCDFTFGNLFSWGEAENVTFSEQDGLLYFHFVIKGVPYYSCPFGEDTGKGLEIIESDSKDRGEKLGFTYLCEDGAAAIKAHFGDRIELVERRDLFDYIYNVSDLANLSGRKYHGKKNHFNSFIKQYDYNYEPLTESNLQECLEFSRSWHDQNEPSPSLLRERAVIERAFRDFFALGLSGALLRADGKVVAYAVGEPSGKPGWYCTHFEKADSSVNGAYAAINKMFAENLSEYECVNREDDTGSPGLREAKLSYHPVLILKKYDAFLL